LSKSCLELGVNRKLVTMCYFSIKSGEGGVGGQKVVPRPSPNIQKYHWVKQREMLICYLDVSLDK
jgi:hypothetical protein